MLTRMMLLAAATMFAGAATAETPAPPQHLAQAKAKAAPAAKRGPEAPVKISTPRLYLIWMNTGAMSKDLAGQKDQIVATDRKLGASVQARLDAVVEGPTGMHDDVKLTIRVTSEGKTIVDQTFLVGFIDSNGRLSRSVIVNHECQPFEIELTLGSAKMTKKVDLTCGG